jgi:hypothetical protein
MGTKDDTRRTREEEQCRTKLPMLPICCFCKQVRTTGGTWQQVDEFIAAHSEAEFTHMFCPACYHVHYGKYLHQANPDWRSRQSVDQLRVSRGDRLVRPALIPQQIDGSGERRSSFDAMENLARGSASPSRAALPSCWGARSR